MEPKQVVGQYAHGGRPMTLRECMDAEDGGPFPSQDSAILEADIGREIPEPFKSAGRMPHFGMTVEYACGCAVTGGDGRAAACATHLQPATKFYEGPKRPMGNHRRTLEPTEAAISAAEDQLFGRNNLMADALRAAYQTQFGAQEGEALRLLREVTSCGQRISLAVETGDARAAEFNKALIGAAEFLNRQAP